MITVVDNWHYFANNLPPSRNEISEKMQDNETPVDNSDENPGHKSVNVTVPGSQPGNQKQGWLQSEKLAHNFMWKIGMRNATALPLLHYMVAHINRGSGGMVVSAQTLAKELEVSPRTIQNAITLLKKWNFIQVLKSGNTNVYIINSQVAWQGNRNGRFATFHATIKVHEDEQDDSVENLIEQAEKLIPVPEMSFLGDLNVDVIDMEGCVLGAPGCVDSTQPTADSAQ